LAELGIWAYISNLNGVPDLGAVASDSQLNVIIAWRIATYHVPLVVMWIALMKLAVGKVSAEDIGAKKSSEASDGQNKKDASGEQA
jgi:uncharacterized membrane protein YbhN (UPF0104 family)